ncbi:site-specific DNA-methyltransferase, partial [Helicobacter sp. MIT 14-3879]
MLPLNQILQGNSLELLQIIPNDSIDLIFADPPYFMRVEGVL